MEKKNEIIRKFDPDLSPDINDLLLDYHGFNLKSLAEKIRLQTIKPKPKMIFY
ncbi:hypothetical protein IJX73_04235 [bacterium]|nr:hypothetical protein [bacterium]